MKVKTLVLLSSIFMLGLWSCSDDKDVVNPDPNPDPEEVVNKYITGVDLSQSYSLPNSHEVGHSVYNVLGYGYDVTGKYAHPSWVKAQVIDVVKLANEKEFSVYESRPHPSTALGVMQGEIKDVLTQTCRARSILLQEKEQYPDKIFKGMLSLPFTDDNSFKDIDYYYSTLYLMSATLQFELFDYDKDDFSEHYLSKEFSDDLVLSTGTEIVEKYGTHVLLGVVLGKREDFIYRSSSKKQLQLGLLVRPEQVFGKKPDSFLYPTMGETYDKENIYHEMIGLKAPKTNTWMIDYTNFPKNKIIETLDFGETGKEDAVLIDFIGGSHFNPLIPIYEVIKDEVKQKEVKEAFEKYLSE